MEKYIIDGEMVVADSRNAAERALAVSREQPAKEDNMKRTARLVRAKARLGREVVKASDYLAALAIGQSEWMSINKEAIKAQLTIYNNMYANAKGKSDKVSKAICAAHEAAQASTAKATLVVNEMRKRLAALIESDIDAAEAALDKVEQFKPASLADIENFTLGV